MAKKTIKSQIKLLNLIFSAFLCGALIQAPVLACGPVSCEDSCYKLPGIETTNNGTRCVESTSSQPVRYLDGVLHYTLHLASFPSIDGSFALALTYHNRPIDAGAVVENGFGYNWYSTLPYIEETASGLRLTTSAYQVSRFTYDQSRSAYVGQDGVWAQITIDQSGYYVLEGTNGGVAEFYGPGMWNSGKIKRCITPYGHEIQFTYGTTGDNRGGTLLDQILEPGGLRWTFSAVGYRYSEVRVFRELESGQEVIIKTINLAYYSSQSEDGEPGDLKSVTIVDGHPQTTDRPSRTTYFRYYTGIYDPESNPGRPHDLKLIIGPMTAERALQAWKAEDPSRENDTFEQIDTQWLIDNKYYDIYVKYYSDGKVAEESIRNGSSCGCGGTAIVGTYTYEYRTGTSGGDYNHRVVAVKQTNPDGSIRYVEVNKVGSAVLSVLEAPDGRKWGNFYVYDVHGQLAESYHPSACDVSDYDFQNAPSDSYDPRKENQGVVDVYQYAYPNAGDAWIYGGRLISHSLRQGKSGTLRKIVEYTYTDPPAHISQIKRYEESTDKANITTFLYQYYEDNVHKVKTKTTYFPTVTDPAEQSNATRIESYNADGTLYKVTDELGNSTYYSYFPGRGLISERKREYHPDPQTTSYIVDSYTYDDFFRKIRHEIKKEGEQPLQVRRWVYSYLFASDGQYDNFPRYVTLAYEHVKEDAGGDVIERDGVVNITVTDLEGRKVEEAVGYIDTTGEPLSSDFNPGTPSNPNPTLQAAFSGKLYNRVTYVYDGPFLKKELRWENAQDQNSEKYVTEYDYDTMGRRIKTIDPLGTVKRLEYDCRGLLTKVWEYLGPGDPDPLPAPIEERYYDGDTDQAFGWIGDGLLTLIVRPASGSERKERFRYDEWNRMVWHAKLWKSEGGEVWFVTENTQIDNADRVIESRTYLGVEDGSGFSFYYSSSMDGELWIKHQENFYDERGRLWKEESWWQEVTSTGPGQEGTHYVTKFWHNKRGDLIKRMGPGLLFEKRFYDELGRLKERYIAYDTDSSTEGDSFENAESTNGDVILLEEQYQYDALGREIFRRTYERKAGEDSSWSVHEGPLSGPDGTSALLPYSVWRFEGMWYSPSGLLLTAVDYGDNGGTHLTSRPTDPPERSSSTALRVDYEYGWGIPREGGNPAPIYSTQTEDTTWIKTTDPEGYVHYEIRDSLGRVERRIRNYEDGNPNVNVNIENNIAYQQDVTSTFEYDALDRTTKAIAWELSEDGGEIQKQITSYEYGVSRADSPVPSEIDTKRLLRAIKYGKEGGIYEREILFAYNEQGEVIWRGARGLSGGSWSWRTKRSFTRDLFGRVSSDRVTYADSDQVDTGISSIDFSFDSHGRLVKVESKDQGGSVMNSVSWSYNLDGLVGSSHQDHGNSFDDFVFYTYEKGAYPVPRLKQITYPVNAGRTVTYSRSGETATEDWQKKDWVVGRITSISDSGRAEEGSGTVSYSYQGLDRVVQLTEGPVTVSFLNPSESLGFDSFGRVYRIKADSGEGTLVDYTYSYDKRHNPTSRTDAGPLERNESFGYDGLSRLVSYDTTWILDDATWDLTAVGNWRRRTLAGSSYDERPGHNERNEITNRTVNEISATPSYDLEGNTTSLPPDVPQESSGSFTLKYDAWNRLVEIKYGTDVLARYERDGLGRIIREEISGEHYFYSLSWQLLSLTDSGKKVLKDYLWGVRYVDEILSTISFDSNGNLKGRLWHIQDSNWNVVASTDSTGELVEYVTYDPYGKPVFWTWNGTSWDRSSSITSGEGCDFLFQGRWYKVFTSGSDYVRLYHFRHRAYSPILGRFLQRDPRRLAEGHSSNEDYKFTRNNPLVATDPEGLVPKSCCCCCAFGFYYEYSKIITASRFGHRIKLFLRAENIVQPNSRYRPCEFEWWEWCNLRLWYAPSSRVWYRTMRGTRGASVDCPGRGEVHIATDKPVTPFPAKKKKKRRVLWIVVIARTAPGCECLPKGSCIFFRQVLEADGNTVVEQQLSVYHSISDAISARVSGPGLPGGLPASFRDCPR